MKNFECNSCGQCCRRVGLNEVTAFLDRGDGICRHLDELSHLCSIYNDRPLVCRVDDYYLAHLTNVVTWEEFVKLNRSICDELQGQLTNIK